jgi:hypothetical protein
MCSAANLQRTLRGETGHLQPGLKEPLNNSALAAAQHVTPLFSSA